MNFNEFLAHAKKVNGMPLDTLAKEVGAHMVLYPETCMKVIEKALKPFESPEDIRWDFLSACLNEGFALDKAVVIATSPWCIKLLGHHDESDKRFVSSQDDLTLALLGGVIEHIKEPENELLFRHNIAGDLAVRNTNNFNTREFLDIANAIIRVNAVYSGNFGKVVKGFTYTHCELTEGDKYVINSMKGVMTVNVE